MDFVCNVCAAEVKGCPDQRVDREIPSCPACNSTVRFRGVIHLLSMALYGRSMPLPSFPADKAIGGIGLSDWENYADVLAKKFTYANTLFHTEPFLDISKPIDADLRSSADFLISTDVFEHVAPPLQKAFDGAFDLLRSGGHMILTVPYSLHAKGAEHYPDLHDYRVVQFGDRYVVLNHTADGKFVVHENPVFHGGPGTTLEMRVPCLQDLKDHLATAGFEFQVVEANVPEWGIVYRDQPDRPILAKKPAGARAEQAERPSLGIETLISRILRPPKPAQPTWRSRLRAKLARIANRVLPR
jgi:hypothetical protein